MSYRPPRNVRRGKPAPLRGPSRPVDPRFAPGGPPKRRLDPFAMGLIGVCGVVLVGLLVVLALQNRGGTTTPTGTQTNGNTIPSGPPEITQTAIAFGTQTAPEVLPRIPVAAAKALYDASNATIIDVREAQFYNQGHIKGALNIPHSSIQTRVSEVPRTGNVILYCQWPHDEESASVALGLRGVGYTNVQILQGPYSYDAWKNAGYPVEP